VVASDPCPSSSASPGARRRGQAARWPANDASGSRRESSTAIPARRSALSTAAHDALADRCPGRQPMQHQHEHLPGSRARTATLQIVGPLRQLRLVSPEPCCAPTNQQDQGRVEGRDPQGLPSPDRSAPSPPRRSTAAARRARSYAPEPAPPRCLCGYPRRPRRLARRWVRPDSQGVLTFPEPSASARIEHCAPRAEPGPPHGTAPDPRRSRSAAFSLSKPAERELQGPPTQVGSHQVHTSPCPSVQLSPGGRHGDEHR
jgi:hypothetical protein